MISMTIDSASFKRDMERFAKQSESAFKKAVAEATTEMQAMAMKKVRDYTSNSKTKNSWLQNNIVTKKLNGGYTGEVISKMNYSQAFEEGTRPHIIRIRNKRVLAGSFRGRPAGWKVSPQSASMGYATYGKEVRHPGTRPHPFMAPAFRHGCDQLEKKINTALR